MPEEIIAKVSGVVFSNRHTGFCILKAIPKNDSNKVITIKGNFFGSQVGVGLMAKFSGSYEDHSTYGRQLVASICEIIPEPGRIGIVTYLSSNVPSIGPITAAKLYSKFGDGLIDILNNDPDQMRSVDFLTKPQADAVIREWSEASEGRTVAIFLTNLGLSSHQAKSVFTKFGLQTRTKVNQNPYCLYECYGVGFVTADNAARKLNIGIDDIRRIKSMILFVLSELSSSDGHVYCTSQQILSYISSKIFRKHAIDSFSHGEYMSDTHFYHGLNDLILDGQIHVDNDRIYQIYNWVFESESSEALAKIIVQPTQINDLEKHLNEFEELNKIELSDEQREAFFMLQKSRMCAISGYPGTGKTTLISAFVHLFEKSSLNYVLMSPTGIAAKRLSQVTGRPASTIHRALGYKRDGTWDFNKHNKFAVDAIIVDEGCLPYKQYINLADGTKEYIGSIVNQKKQVDVLSFNLKTRVVEPRKIINWFKYERRDELYKVFASHLKTHNYSRILNCTSNHKVYTSKGQKKASDLVVGDDVIVRGKFMNDFQRSFILGSLLGDSCCSRFSAGSCGFSFVHGKKQLDYLSFKARLFDACIRESIGGFVPSKKLYHAVPSRLEEADAIHRLVYKNGRKTINQKWLDQIDDIGLAAWYMDDGQLSRQFGKNSKNASLSAFLHTEGFSYKENLLICKWLLNKWNLKASVYSNGSRGHHYIRITSDSSKRFWDIVRPYIIKSMSYKIPGDQCDFQYKGSLWRDIGLFKIRKINKYIPKIHKKYVYDIEVEGNHNYFSNNILISNSMLDIATFYHLISSLLSTTIIVMIGDSAQLPSVGAGYVLGHLMECSDVPHVSLTKIYRQEKQSDIIKIAHLMLHNQPINTDFKKNSEFVFLKYSKDQVMDEICKLSSIMKSKDQNFQVIAPMYAGDLGIDNLNRRLRGVLNTEFINNKATKLKSGDVDLYEGDRVIVIKNDYDRMLFNGDAGKIQSISIKNNEVEVKIFGWFDSETNSYADKCFIYTVDEARQLLKVAFACSVHRCQGQEYDYVIMPMTMQYGIMLYKNLVYTAITRAKKKVFLFGDPDAFTFAASCDRDITRNSNLAELVHVNTDLEIARFVQES